jgi:hypothetical protein
MKPNYKVIIFCLGFFSIFVIFYKNKSSSNYELPFQKKMGPDVNSDKLKITPKKITEVPFYKNTTHDPRYNSQLNDKLAKESEVITKKTTQEIYTRMKKDEISSLKQSIINDELLLKKIESEGSGIEDYKFISANLKKRKARLAQLSKQN